jgi:GNAT superfamily N-acetyltransferase
MDGSRLTVDVLEAAAADDPELPRALAALVNRVYAVGEAGLWKDGFRRISPEAMTDLIRAGEIAVARVRGRIVGCVRIRRLDDRVAEFGLLAADPEHRGIGVGRALVEFAEERNRERGAQTLQLHLLVPTVWTHPIKRFLDQWYTRLGYQVVGRQDFAEAEPAMGPLLATPCLLLTYQKPA